MRWGIGVGRVDEDVRVRDEHYRPSMAWYRASPSATSTRWPPQDLARRLEELEQRYDAQFRAVFDAIRELMAKPDPRRRPIGFRVQEAGPAFRVRRPRAQSAR
jgi:hypothetical protein